MGGPSVLIDYKYNLETPHIPAASLQVSSRYTISNSILLDY